MNVYVWISESLKMIEVRQQVAMILMDALVRWDCLQIVLKLDDLKKKKKKNSNSFRYTSKSSVIYVKYTLGKGKIISPC